MKKQNFFRIIDLSIISRKICYTISNARYQYETIQRNINFRNRKKPSSSASIWATTNSLLSARRTEEPLFASNIEVVDTVTQNLNAIVPGTYIGSGKLNELKTIASALEADYVIFNDELSPAK